MKLVNLEVKIEKISKIRDSRFVKRQILCLFYCVLLKKCTASGGRPGMIAQLTETLRITLRCVGLHRQTNTSHIPPSSSWMFYCNHCDRLEEEELMIHLPEYFVIFGLHWGKSRLGIIFWVYWSPLFAGIKTRYLECGTQNKTERK